MSFHIGFSFTRVVTKATEKGSVFTVQVVIQEVVNVLAGNPMKICIHYGKRMEASVQTIFCKFHQNILEIIIKMVTFIKSLGLFTILLIQFRMKRQFS